MSSRVAPWSPFFPLVLLIVALIVAFAGCTTTRYPAQSWDQANLKRNDHGCPTAIFVAPAGELQQCQQAVSEADILAAISAPHTQPTFTTIEDAAIAGLKLIAAEPTSSYYEWGGSIIQTQNGKFAPAEPRTDYAGDHVNTRGHRSYLDKVVGSYHSHPCIPGYFAEYFSPPDTLEAIFYHRIAFMGDFCTGGVHEFKPGDKPDVDNVGDDTGLFLTKGRIVGKFTTPHVLAVVE